MRRIIVLLACLPLLAQPPVAKREPVTETLHGVKLTDPYRWLEDQNSPATRAWIDSEVRYTNSVLSKLPFRAKLRDRLKALEDIESVSLPYERAGRYFFRHHSPGQDQPVIEMRNGIHGANKVLVDPNPWSKDHTISASTLEVSKDGRLLLYGKREGGEDEVTPVLLDVDTGKTVGETFRKARYQSFAMLPDKSGLYYSIYAGAGPRAYFHKMGTDPAHDRLIFGEGYSTEYGVGADLSEDGKYLILTAEQGSAGTRTEIFVQNLRDGGPIRPIVKGIEAKFEGGVGGDTLFVKTNWKAPNSRVLAIDLRNPAQDHWREIVAERPSSLEEMQLIGGEIGLSYIENVHSKIEIVTADGKPVRAVQLPGIGTTAGPNGRWESKTAMIQYASFAQPPIIYDYNVDTGATTVWHEAKAPFDPKSMVVEQVWFESKDKTRIPMFLIHKKDMPRDGNRPVYLTGYGGFDISLTPHFQATAVIWAEMGGLFAVPNLRGGGEFGEKWHHAGMFGNKQNVFDDFISAAQYLIAQRYTKPSRIGIEGGSNGGLLVGAVMTERPDLFGAVVCTYPLLDMIRYQNFKVAKFWVSEYGSSENAEQFRYILKYSPYQNVKKGVKYPPVMFVTGDADTRVDPLHARKMTALMQADAPPGDVVLLHYDVKGGHSGGLPITRLVENQADELAFLVWQLGMQK
jgi:prolyl oligopeptidase